MVKESMKVGNLVLPNRIIMPPMATAKCAEDGKVTGELIAYYGERAANPHVGTIITEHCYISLQGKAGDKQVSLASDDVIEGISKMVAEIHKYGKIAIAQINHNKVDPTDLSLEEIKSITEDFAAAARRAKEAGYDGVEIHSAHAYLLNQFYSPLTNLRTDEYGGSLDNRLRFHKEVIAAVRKSVGDDYPVAIRLGGCDYREGGSTIEDSVYAAKVFQEAGVDMLDLSGGLCFFMREGHDEPGYFQDMTSAIKKEVSIPVMLTGGIKTLEEAEELLEKDAADLIGIGRELLKNANWEE